MCLAEVDGGKCMVYQYSYIIHIDRMVQLYEPLQNTTTMTGQTKMMQILCCGIYSPAPNLKEDLITGGLVKCR